MRSFFSLLALLFYHANFAQQTDYVDFKRAEVNIYSINPLEKEISGRIAYHFEILTDVDSIYIDAKNFIYTEISLNNHEARDHEYDGEHIIVKEKFRANTSHILYISWVTKPKKAMYFVGWKNNAPNQIWTQGQGKYTSNWMPSMDDMNEKIEFDLSITFDKDYSVISNGKLIKKDTIGNDLRWHYDMKEPMSSYLLALTIGKYKKKTVHSNTGIPIEMYYYPKDSIKFEPTYRYTQEMFHFLEKEIGVLYPWQNYKQVPVHDFLYAGMENTTTTIFSDAYMVDSIGFADKNYVNINAHELAHQWFGNLVTESSGTHHWLQEGFATYYALLAEKKAFGDNYFYWKLYESAQQLEAQDLSGQNTALLDPESSSLTFYQKGAWTLYMLRELVGDLIFKKAIVEYLEKHKFKNVSTADFLGIVEDLSGQDLTLFAYEWLRNDDFPYERSMDALKQNSMFIQEYLMVDCEVITSKCADYLVSGISDDAKFKLIAQVPEKITSEVFRSSIKVRQAIAIYLKDIPAHLKADYESLLDDKSYITIENTLFNLWNNFPEDRIKYLTKTKSIQGLNNKNVRLLWLLLANITLEYEEDSRNEFTKELLEYTSPQYNFEIRITAFEYLKMIMSCGEQCMRNLEEAKSHHNWQLAKFAKHMLDTNKK